MKLRDRFFADYLDIGEKILHVAHRHILVLKIKTAKVTFFGFVIPGLLFIMFPSFYAIFLIWGCVGLMSWLYCFVDWFYDAWILTNLGVIDVRWDGFFDSTTTRIEYHMIEGTQYQIKGFLPTVFNYGDIVIDKLGAKTSVVLNDAANPKKLERLVMKYQEAYVYDRSIRDHSALKDMLSDMIAYHVQSKKVRVPNKKE